MWSSYKFVSQGWALLMGGNDEADVSKAENEVMSEAEESAVAQLPPEQLTRIFSLLIPRDLRSVVQVCRLWREEGERPGLWTWGVVRATRENMSTIAEVLATRRMLLVEELRVEDWQSVSRELLEAVARHRGLRRLDLRSATGLAAMEPGLLARAVAGLEEVQTGYSHVSSQQAETIFTVIAGQTKLRKINFFNMNLFFLEPGLLARAVVKLEDVQLGVSPVSIQQAEAIMRALIVQTKLRRLQVSFNNISSLEPGLLATVVAELEEVNLGMSRVSSHQAEAIFTAVTDQTKLRKLVVPDIDLSSITPDLLARSVTKLEEVQFCRPVSDQQAEAIFAALAVQTTLKKLYIAFKDLSSLEAGMLARGVVGLEDVSLRNTQLTIQQVEAILTAIGKDTRLKKLNLKGNTSLASIDPNILARSITQLKKVNIGNIRIRQPQLLALFTAVKEPIKLKTLKIGVNADLNQLEPDIKKKIVNIQAQVSLALANVTRDSVLETKSLISLEWTFACGYFRINLEKDRFKMIQTYEQSICGYRHF